MKTGRSISWVLPILLVLIVFAVIWLVVSWWSYAGGTWVDSRNNIKYTYVAHHNYGIFIAGVIYPYYVADVSENPGLQLRGGDILVDGEVLHFPRGKPFLIISKDGKREYLDLPPELFEADDSTKYAHPDIDAMKSSGIWSSKIEPLLGQRPHARNSAAPASASTRAAKPGTAFSIYIESWDRISFENPPIAENGYSKWHSQAQAATVIGFYLERKPGAAEVMLAKNLHINDKGFQGEIDEIQKWLVSQGVTDIVFRLATSAQLPPVVREYRNGRITVPTSGPGQPGSATTQAPAIER